MNKFKAEVFKQFRASDGTTHETRDAHEQHERKILVDRVAGYVAADLDAAVLGNNVPVATDIILLASLLRPPRAKRVPANPSPPAPSANTQTGAGSSDAAHADDTGQSASDPTAHADGSATQSPSANGSETAAEHSSGHDNQPPHEAPEAHEGQRASAPSEHPEAGDAPAPVASLAGQGEAGPTANGPDQTTQSTVASSHSAGKDDRANTSSHKRGKAREGAAA